MAAFLLYCLTLFQFFPILSSAQSTANIIPIGASLTAAENSNPWRSPSGDFAFGFQQLPDNKDLFVLSIWFDKIPEKTIVWHEKRSYPVPRRSTVQLDSTEGIVVRSPQGTVLYRTDAVLYNPVANAFMNDTGNFVLRDTNSTLLWESFKNPTDTILPTQTIQIGGMLNSRLTATNYSSGKFFAYMNINGNFELKTKSVPSNVDFLTAYYATKTSEANTSNSGFQLAYDERALLWIVRRNGERFILGPSSNPPPAENYYRTSLDFDGVFAQYSHPKNFSGDSRGGWVTARYWPRNICTDLYEASGSGACGYNSVCTMRNGRPFCQCLQGFTLNDPNNVNGDCRPNFVQICVQGEHPDVVDFELVNISDVSWPMNSYQVVKPITQDQCHNLCLNDCFCRIASFRNGSCWKKSLPLSNGRFISSLDGVAFLKMRKGESSLANPNCLSPTSSRGRKGHHRGALFLVLSVLLGSSIFINFFSCCLGYYLSCKRRFRTLNPASDTSQCVRCFTYKELVQATNGFKEELGRGSFGIVYKGVIQNDPKSTIVAVKKLDRVSRDFEKEFKAEVSAIGQTHHKNLVRLIGYCNEGPHRLLAYEYMSNGTLASFLFGDTRPSWSQRMQIALGIARGLTYLHEECNTRIIHCDIKPHNILLDESHNARISDFGLAKILMMNQSRTLTNIRGTKGYVAPEWFKQTRVTSKVDVYSFGVLLLEIITCRKNVLSPNGQLQGSDDKENPILTDWVWDCFNEGRVDTLVGNDEEALCDRRALKRYVMIGIWCIQEDALKRPTMRETCQMLEGIVEIEVPPCPDATFT